MSKVNFSIRLQILSNFDDRSSDKGASNDIDNGESGWDFWSRVYDDPVLRSQITDRFHVLLNISIFYNKHVYY